MKRPSCTLNTPSFFDLRRCTQTHDRDVDHVARRPQRERVPERKRRAARRQFPMRVRSRSRSLPKSRLNRPVLPRRTGGTSTQESMNCAVQASKATNEDNRLASVEGVVFDLTQDVTGEVSERTFWCGVHHAA